MFATPAWLRIPTPTTLIFATSGSVSTTDDPIDPRFSSRMACVRARSARPTVNVMSVSPSADTFCTIMSTFTLAAESGPKIAAATPGRSGTCRSVIFASSRE